MLQLKAILFDNFPSSHSLMIPGGTPPSRGKKQMTRSMWLFRFALPEGQTLAPPGVPWEVERHVAQLSSRSMSLGGSMRSKGKEFPQFTYVRNQLLIDRFYMFFFVFSYLSLIFCFFFVYFFDMWPSSVKGSGMDFWIFSKLGKTKQQLVSLGACFFPWQRVFYV